MRALGKTPHGYPIYALKPLDRTTQDGQQLYIIMVDRGFEPYGLLSWATWQMREDGVCEHGHYDMCLESALEDFNARPSAA